ncbi:DUF5695 domain-containing protein [Arachidicoccus sp.]|uniref:DUF5695 domain-containing protein n=1 Tax=Arachidicoccus sp. TaxID=1872624 RepID=UPI003D1FEAA2
MSLKNFLVFSVGILINSIAYGQYRRPSVSAVPTLDLKAGFIHCTTPNFSLSLVRSSQTVASLYSRKDTVLDFTPGDRLQKRDLNRQYYLGDINIGLRLDGNRDWKFYSSANERQPILPLCVEEGRQTIAAADLKPTLPKDIPLDVKRYWIKVGDDVALRFTLTNNGKSPVEVGYIGIPMIFNNMMQGEDLDITQRKNVFYDPYIGMDAGYLQVTRLSGVGSALLVLPEAHTPFEAYNPLLDDPTPRGSDFEGSYEWVVCSLAKAQTAWKDADSWNKPSSFTLKPGQQRTVGVRFVLSPSIPKIENTLAKEGRPVAVGIPGYVLPEGVNGSLFLKYNYKVSSIEVYPSGALSFKKISTLKNGWEKWLVKGEQYGRARLTVKYTNGLVQTIQYKVIESESKTIRNYGNFLAKNQWFDQPDTFFHRAPSFISYDHILHKQVTQNNRAWIAGLSDEGGAGSWLGMVMKQSIQPDKSQVDKVEQFIDTTLWGHIQYKTGPWKYGVRKSLFYYAPDSLPAGTYNSSINFKTWSAWPLKEAASVGRSYNYPHVVAAYWAMYRIAHFHQGLVTNHQWHWYLEQAFHTSLAMINFAPYYTQFGQMEGTVFYLLLQDLKHENLVVEANELEQLMRKRAIHWRSLAFPFGSEMPWDSTGQEEVFAWSLYFGFYDKALSTIDAIMGYMPAIPSWAYNGNARRYWDFIYAGKLQRIERMVHHYGSELNAIPVLTWYRLHPEDFYLLRIGYGGLLGGISNIEKDGFAPLAFHAFPGSLKEDGFSGDYGSGFFGYAINSATYIIKHPEFGWLAFGGNLEQDGNWIKTLLTTASCARVFLAPEKLWITLKAGKLEEVEYNSQTAELRLKLSAKDSFTKEAVLNIIHPSGTDINYHFASNEGMTKDGKSYIIPLADSSLTVVLKKNLR